MSNIHLPASTPTDHKALRTLTRRTLARMQLVIAHELYAIATTDESSETRRKACVDLLRVDAAEPTVDASSPNADLLDGLIKALHAITDED
ncbi:MAG: hypothetical protein AAGI30_02250 [Planctomycetota bacterium]